MGGVNNSGGTTVNTFLNPLYDKGNVDSVKDVKKVEGSGNDRNVTFSDIPTDEVLYGTSERRGASSAESLQRFEAALATLDGFLKGASSKDLLFAALVELAGQQRQSAVDARSAARNEAKGQLLNAADKTFEAADKQRAAATTALVMGLVSATISIVQGALSLGTVVKGGFGKKADILKQNANQAMKPETPTPTPKPQTVGPSNSQTPPPMTKPQVTTTQTGTTTSTTNAPSGPQQQSPTWQKATPSTDQRTTDVTVGQNRTAPTDGTKKTDIDINAKDATEELSAKAAAIGKHTDYVNSQVQLIGAFGMGFKGLSDAIGSSSKFMEADATTLQAKGQQQQALAQDTQQEQDIQKKFAEDMHQAIQQAIQFIKQMQDAEVERASIANKA